jgi:hypothetical protein
MIRITLQHHANFTALKALICAGRIAEKKAACYIYMLQQLESESILFSPELMSSRVFYLLVHKSFNKDTFIFLIFGLVGKILTIYCTEVKIKKKSPYNLY